ncbi:hypothetical protein B7L88_gp095 [Rhizobium phage RHEph10]|uniref:hypothetical protein n=1 Tax=Rhizobium phage RHEph10 TaxID=1220717 RepID=UPI0002AB5130|nr:hypothetical protein B7L88_gp095 [Rhizobium phage RHEph10]AGC36193.1 hypothetical protein RHEph10_gp150 [Rhizobium phage RHEph10]
MSWQFQHVRIQFPMNLSFPARGPIIVRKVTRDEPTRIIEAPLETTVDTSIPGIEYHNSATGPFFIVRDEAGTALTYRVTEMTAPVWGPLETKGTLVGIEHAPQGVISIKEHDDKLSAAIDIAFEAGVQNERQENQEAVKRIAADLVTTLDEPNNVLIGFTDGQFLVFPDIVAYSELDGQLSLETTVGSVINVHPSWRSYELEPITDAVDEDDDDVELINPLATLEGVSKGEAAGCGCDVCDAARAEELAKAVWDGIWADKKLDLASVVSEGARTFWKPRYGPVGNRIDDE